jgi:anti-sigma regulatory factor (Ser/Thr protein kinase)
MRGRVDAEAEVTGLSSGGLRHVAFFYRDQASRRTEILRFARAGLGMGEPALIALPGDEADRIADQLAGEPGELLCIDMNDLGRNPARIIPALRAFVDKHAGRRVRLVEEPVWPGRSAAEAIEAIRGDALINLALAGTRASVLCPFDAASLPARIIAGAQQTHPEYLASDPNAAGSRQAHVPWQIPAGYDDPLPPPPATAESLSYDNDLSVVRGLVERHARRSGLGRSRASDLVLSVSEVAANTLEHTRTGGTLQVWDDDAEILCQTHDTGWITDPLAGRVRTGPESRGHGLFVVNQVCDLVELRTGQAGTTIRLHMQRDLV